MSYLGTQFAGLDPDVEAERNRMTAEREARIAEMKAAEHEEVVLPVLRLADALEGLIPAERIPDAIRVLRTAKPSTLERALAQLGARHSRREAENARLRDAEIHVARLRAAKRQAELDAGAV